MGNAWLKRLTKRRWVESGVERHKHVYKREGYIEHINGFGNKHYVHVMMCMKGKSFVTICDDMSFTGIVDFVPERRTNENWSESKNPRCRVARNSGSAGQEHGKSCP